MSDDNTLSHPNSPAVWSTWGLRLCALLAVLAALKMAFPAVVSQLTVLESHWLLLAVAVVLRLAFTTVQGLRLHALTRTSLPEVSQQTVVRATYIGQMCNQFLPGGIGGDIVRGALVGRKHRIAWQRLLGWLLVDRLVGVCSLTALVLLLCPMALLSESTAGWKALSVAGAAALLGLAWLSRHQLVKGALRVPGLRAVVLMLPSGLEPGQLRRVSAFAFLGHGLFLVSGAMVFSAAELPLDWTVRLGMIAFSAYVGSLPLSFGSQGIREGTLFLMLSDPFHWWSSTPPATPDQAFVVAAGLWLLHIATSTFGGIVALAFQPHHSAPTS
jgi:hypothetical protein